MSDPIQRHAQARPDAPALWMPSRRWTYAELESAVSATQGRLRREGIQPGNRVALHLSRGADVVVLLWALWRTGAVAVPLSTRLPVGEVGSRVQQVGGQFLIAGTSEVRERTSGDWTALAPDAVVRKKAGDGASVSSLDQDRSSDRPATILFTSGSTGAPKAVLHSWANHLYSAKGANATVPLQSEDRWLLSLPPYHVGGLAVLVRCALAGAAVAVPENDAPLAGQLRATGATHVSLVATQFRRVLDAAQSGPPASLRAVLLGGGPIPRGLLRRGKEHGWPLHTTYGCTEMASQVTTTAPGAPFDTLETAGRPLPHRRVRIDDGEIQVAGAPLFRGYVTADGLADPRTDEGWYATGDRGKLDASGRLYVLGRMDRMFVSGGENIQPEEIEAALEQLDKVERAVVVPVPNAEYGRRPVAFVRTTEDVAAQRFDDPLAEVLPRFKIPDTFHSLPKEAAAHSLTIDRAGLRKRARMLQKGMNPGDGDP